MSRRRHLGVFFSVRCALALVLALCVLPAFAQTRAWLDRDRINANETVTLNIKTDGMARPDYDPLQRDFSISGRSSRTQMDNTGVHSLYAVALQPRRAGTLVIPALAVGNARTQPLNLQVWGFNLPMQVFNLPKQVFNLLMQVFNPPM